MGSLAVAPVVPGSQIPLDLDKELLPICNLVGVPMALIVRPNAPYKTVAELIAYARENPGKVTYGSTGNGSTNQLGAELFAKEAGGLKLLHIPYRGGAPALVDLLGGRVQVRFGVITESLEYILFQPHIRHEIGWDYSLGVAYRPFLINNMTMTFGAATLKPGRGFRDIYTTAASDCPPNLGDFCTADKTVINPSKLLFNLFGQVKVVF